MKNIYESEGKYYKRIRACSGRFEGMFEWQPLVKILLFYIPDFTKERFILDDYGFESICSSI